MKISNGGYAVIRRGKASTRTHTVRTHKPTTCSIDSRSRKGKKPLLRKSVDCVVCRYVKHTPS